MTDFANRVLLPAGLRDILPLDAGHEAEMAGRIMAHFTAHGYERVKPPLIEFEETLLAGADAAAARHCFRVMDPLSQKMMGLRADMTPQVARIATVRLAGSPRPLRLSYAGQVLRVKGTQLRPERQFGQAGIELIGADCAEADAEVAVLAYEALADLGMAQVSIDLSLPSLVAVLLDEMKLAGAKDNLRGSLDHKDQAAVAAMGGPAAPILSALLSAVGPVDRALTILAGLDLPPRARAQCDRLAQVVALIRRDAPGVTLTVDPVENRGFEYHQGVAFTLFTRALSGELGRGGRYMAAGVEPAVGATLFMDTILEALPEHSRPRRVYVPVGTARTQIRALQDQDWITVAGLEPTDDIQAEARRLDCGHVLMDGEPRPV